MPSAVPPDAQCPDVDAGDGYMTSPIARGSPFLTMLYSGLTPVINSATVISNYQAGPITGTRFVFFTNGGQQWLVYTSSPITFVVSDNVRAGCMRCTPPSHFCDYKVVTGS